MTTIFVDKESASRQTPLFITNSVTDICFEATKGIVDYARTEVFRWKLQCARRRCAGDIDACTGETLETSTRASAVSFEESAVLQWEKLRSSDFLR